MKKYPFRTLAGWFLAVAIVSFALTLISELTQKLRLGFIISGSSFLVLAILAILIHIVMEKNRGKRPHG